MEAVCSKCQDIIVNYSHLNYRDGRLRWHHVDLQGRIGRVDFARYIQHKELGCYNSAIPVQEAIGE